MRPSIKIVTLTIATLAYATLSPLAAASVTLGATRLIYNESNDSISLSVNDDDKTPYLVQSWVSTYANAAESGKPAALTEVSNIPFIVTPPLFKMESGDSNTLNIVKTSQSTLPNDRESIFYLNVKAIPGKVKDNNSSIMISVKSSLKLFYRPAQIEGDKAANAWAQLSFQQQGKSLIAKNPTPYYITFYELVADGNKINEPQNSMVAPYGKLTYPVKGSVRTISWKAIGDLGQITDEKVAHL